MTSFKSTLSMDSGVRLLRVVRWLLPVGLAAVALLFELNEHVGEDGEEIEPFFFFEIVLFAVIGPVAVAITLGWVVRLVTAYQETSAELAETNRDLETRIEERTAHLAEAGEQLRLANAQLAAVNEELRQLDRLKSEFVSLVSHQLRAPLTNINGALEIVAQDAESLPKEAQRTLSILVREGQRLSWLIGTILDVSRIEAGQLKPRLGPVAVGPLLAEACAESLGIEAEHVQHLSVPDGLPPAWADETLIGEVIRNLIENAVRYSPTGSEVVVSARQIEEYLEIAVSDHGSGVPLAEQERVFQAFRRLSDDEASVKGSGLGLYFADRLVRAQGGSISVDSPIWSDETAPGSRFSFRLPVAEDAPDDISSGDQLGPGGTT